MALRGRRTHNFIELWFEEVWKFKFCQPVLKKMASASLNSLRQKGYYISVKNWISNDPFHKKGQELVIRVVGLIRPSGSVILDKMRLSKSAEVLRP